MAIVIKKIVSWETYWRGAMGFGLVGMRTANDPKDQYDAATIFAHKLCSDEMPYEDEAKMKEIDDDCKALVALLKKFNHELDYIEE